MALTIGVDVGGTTVAAGVVDEQGGVLATAKRDTLLMTQGGPTP
jgi:glucokinase